MVVAETPVPQAGEKRGYRKGANVVQRASSLSDLKNRSENVTGGG